MVPNELRAMISLAKRAYDQAMEPVCARHSLTRMELDVMLFLANNPGFDTAAELVSLRRLTKSHVSAAVASLSERGMLVKEYRDGNRKTAHLLLTEAASEAVEDGRAAQNHVQSAILEGFTPEEVALMDRASARIVENLRRTLE